jgi:hypothetical protein
VCCAQIQQQTGATVISRGRFRPPHEADLPVTSPADRPLYLHVSAATQQEVDNAVSKINTLMKGEISPFRVRSVWCTPNGRRTHRRAVRCAVCGVVLTLS